MKKVYLLLLLCCCVAASYAQTTTFNFNGTAGLGSSGINGTTQTYVVPAGVTYIGVDMKGGKGGFPCCSWTSGGPVALGGRVQCTLNVTPGQTLYINVGGGGADNLNSGSQSPGGWNGGGIGGDPSGFNGYCAAGGGASDIRTSATGAYATSVLVVAGGGGGGGDFSPVGGAGGGVVGGTGQSYPSLTTTGGACGGGQTGPSCTTGSGLGTQGQGGSCVCYSNGGGGGGWWGGNGGASPDGAGGGGSSYPAAPNGTVTAITHTQGYTGANGNGQVILTQLCTNPAANTGGASAICSGTTTTFANVGTTGSWVSSNTALATVGSNTGVVSGVSAGVVTISYLVPGGCYASSTLTVNAGPSVSSITTNAPFCSNNGTNLTLTANSPASVSSYSWTGPGAITGASTASASVPAATDANTGVYSLTLTSASGCVATYTTAVTINLGPTTIAGNLNACVGLTNTLSNSVTGGTWASGTAAVATINPTSGVVTGVAAGTTIITYALPSSCIKTAVVTVSALPALSVSPSSTATVCLNSGAIFAAAASGATFSWAGASGTSDIAGATTGTATITPTATGANIYSVTATGSTGCPVTNTVTVNVNPVPAAIAGNTSICVGTTAAYISSAGGTWSSSDVSKATVGATSGIVTGINTGTSTISYTLSTGCAAKVVVTVAPAPANITGTPSVCLGLTTTLSHSVAGGTWVSGSPAIAAVNSGGVVTGLATGTANITYTLPSGCTTYVPVVVNPQPAAITGNTAICQGTTSNLSDATSGGTWTSSLPSVAAVNAFGVVTGSSTGNAVITYTLSTGCTATAPVTVNLTPAAITGTSAVCISAQTNLSDATGGGNFTSGNTSVATVNTSGLVTGIATGNATITYSLTTGCTATQVVTVNPLPSALTGAMEFCQGSTTNLADADAGGTWASSYTTVATVNTSGTVTGNSAGNATITYTLATGCRRTTVVTVDPLPGTISGTTTICIGATTTLFDATSGGAWSTPSSAASVDGAGVVTGNAAGIANIVYTLPTGCSRSIVVTVNPTPSAITGNLVVCSGATTSLSSASTGGTWSSNNYSIASIDATGTVTGGTAGNASVTYTLPTGCRTAATITVNPLPAVITGVATVCEGQTTTLHDATTGGTWSSDAAAIATVSASGVVTGTSQGNVNIIFTTTATGCLRSRVVTVNPTPAAIGGLLSVCQGLTTTLTNSSAGGTWVSGTTGIATIDASGMVSGIAAGNSTITYTLPQGCSTTAQLTVNSLPADITGNTNVCQGLTTTLSSMTAGGAWSNAGTGYTSVSATGVVTGTAAGTEAITYTLPTGCIKTTNVVVNPLPAAISGNLFVCTGLTTALGNATGGGTWSSSAPAIATINTSGVATGVAAGSANIRYTLPTGCVTTSTLVVNALPADISGNSTVCPGTTTALGNANTGGTWSSSTPAVATIDASGTLTGVAAGAATITYSLSTGCTKTKTITVNPLPAAIIGNAAVCQGTTQGLSDASTGGTWSSSASGVATINGSGLVTGVAAGNAVITYTLATGCYSLLPINVTPTPAPITGIASVCPGTSTTLDDVTPGGVWGTPSANANVTLAGSVTGISAGTATISYVLSSGCVRTRTVTVNPLPAAITGTSAVCPGNTTMLSEDATTGNWSSHQPLIATVDAFGMVSGVAAGVTTVTYTLPTGCYATKTVTVNPAPAAITGNASVCNGSTTALTSATTGGSWMSDNTTIATVGAISGVVSAMNPGYANISYTLSTGCMTSYTVTINAAPSAILGASASCIGDTHLLTNAQAGGTWTSSNTAVATISATGSVTGVSAGNTMLTYTLPSGCASTSVFVVNPMPATNTLSGGGNYCTGGTGVAITTDGSTLGNTYTLKMGTATVATSTGTGAPITFGTFATEGTYSLVASTAAGCSANMAGTATITALPLIVPTVSVSSSVGDSVCAGTAATFTSAATNGGTAPVYTWKVNGVTVASTTTSYSYTPANNDIVSVSLTSNATCASPATVTNAITMVVIPMQTPSISIAAIPGNSVCAGTTVTFMSSATSTGTVPHYTWFKNSILYTEGASFSYIPENGDVIVCRLNSSYRCPSTNDVPSNSIVMTVNNVYVPVVSIVANPGTDIQKGQTVDFTTIVSNEGPAAHYQWLVNGVAISGATGTTFSYSHFNDGDSVTCEVYGSGDCGLKTINSVVMRVSGTTGVAHTNAANTSIRLVPNPNTGTFAINGTLSSTADEEVTFDVTDMLGQVVYSTKVTVTNGVINTRVQLGNTLANGMYLLNMHTNSEHQVFSFIVKQ